MAFVAICKCGWREKTNDKKRAEVLADVHEAQRITKSHKHDTRVVEVR